MISNFNEVEKSLKRCLKEKISITTATVVGFLIAGTVAFGGGIYDNESFKEEIDEIIAENTNQSGLGITENTNFNGVEYVYEGTGVIKRLITVEGGKTTLDENTSISTEKNITLLNIYGAEVENKGTLTNTNTGGMSTVTVNAFGGNTSFTNSGTITKEGQGGAAIDLAAGKDYTSTFTNTGTINGLIKSDNDGRQLGNIVINLKDSSKINGKFSFYGGGTRTINIDNNNNGDKELTINNTYFSSSNDTFIKAKEGSKITLNGKIQSKETTVEFNNSTLINNAMIIGNTGISLLNGAIGTNTKDGSITVSGENAIGVVVEGSSTTFTNNGIIELKDGTTNGVGISINKGTATNNGTIVLGLGTIENSNNIAIKNEGGTAKNTGKIKITDKASEELKDFDISTLFNGSYDNTGMIVGKDGIAIKQEGDTVIAGDTDTGTINNAKQEGSNVVITGGITIKGSTDQPIEVESLNVTGKVTIANGDSNKGVEIKGTTTNLDANGSLAIGSEASKAGLTITNGTVNAEDKGTAVTFAHEDSSLELSGTTFNGNIGSGTTNGTVKTSEGEKATVITGNIEAKSVELAGTTAITGNIETKSVELAGTTAITGNIKTESMAVTAGETKIDGIITGATEINIGINPEIELILLSRAASTSSNSENATVAYSADSKIIGKGVDEKTTVNIGANGILKAEVDNDGKNLFGNSTNINVSGDGTIQFLVSNVTKENLELQFGTTVNISEISNILTDSEFYSYDNTNKMLSFIKNNVNNKDLADIYNKSFVINNVLAQTRDAREAQLDSIYSNNVYSETVKMSMDTLRMNEEAVLSLGGKPEEGKWTAQGKMLFSRTEYDRDGKVNSYGVETKTAGLLGAMEYGLSEKSSVGFAFSGTKQDLDMKKASADGDAFYFGVYGKQDINNFKLTAGLGYQLNKIDADNNVIDSTGDKYDSKAFSGYAQGKYVINAGNNVTVEPKVKLALTRLTQESAKDKHFEMEKENITTFDTEVGVDLVKSVKLESGKMNLLAGISYTRTVGDTDDKFKGNFIGTDGTRGDKFDLIGANLGENTLKINIGAEVEKDNGFFYNGGLNYKFDNEDRETFGATIGAGYKF